MAEAAEQFGLMIAWGGLLVASITAFVAFTTRSWIPVVISAIAVAGVTIQFMPWNAFAAVGAEDLEDPDVVHWVSAWRVMASAWIVVVLLTLAAAVVVKVRRSRRAA